MKTPLLHFGLGACAVLAACASNDDSSSVPERLAPGPAIAGATPHTPIIGRPGAVPEFSAALSAPTVATLDDVRAGVDTPGVHITSINSRLGVPSVMWARTRASSLAGSRAGAAPATARAALHRFGPIYGLAPKALEAATPIRVHDTGRGAIIVSYGQSVGGVDVFGVQMNVVLDRAGDLVALTGSLHPAARANTILPPPTLSADEAAEIAIRDAAGGAVHVLTRRVAPVLYPLVKSLELAQLVEIEIAAANSSDSRAYAYVIADDGRILERQNRTFSDSFGYRVWADTTAPYRPLDGPQGDWSPHPTGIPEPLTPQFVAPSLVSVEAFNTNPQGSSDPWLPAGATVTAGNNVDAYADHFGPDGFGQGDLRADTNATQTFDYVFDPTIGPFDSEEQIKASVVQIFYTINWLHDFYYDSGFNESARVAQEDNYGRGPGAGDALLAEAQDTRGDSRNNANMSTLSDGISPRMQMYVWNGPVELIGETRLTITAPAQIAGDYPAQGSSFGVDAEVTAAGTLTLTTPADGCTSITGDLSGRVAVIDRGDCTFVEKSQNAIAAGAAAVIIVNNLAGSPDALPPLGGTDGSIAIPVLGISFADGGILKDALAADSVSADTSRAGRIRGSDRDGTVDNAIVAHEWGHYFHHRLSFCGGTQQCGAMSEGWGDFMSVQLIMREGDDLDGVYGVPSFVSSDPYFGIRRVPYSVSFDKNALTFRHIGADEDLPTDQHPMQAFGANNEVHNAGEVWTTMLTEAYVALLRDERHTFDVAQRRFSDYLVAGLLASPSNATFTEVRDSILAAAAATDADDMLVLAAAFARRGAGTGARSPDRGSDSMNGVQESYELAGQIAADSIDLAGDLDCDDDANWDAGETATLTVSVTNAGPMPLTATELSIIADHPGVSFPAGSTATIDELAGFETASLDIAVELAEGTAGPGRVRFDVTVTNADSLTTDVTTDLVTRVNFDDVAASSTSDDVESEIVAWGLPTDVETLEWSRELDASAENTVWRGRDPSTRVDLRLESPILEVGDDDLVIHFDHRYQFEESNEVAWDGGVIELSADGGSTWIDVGQRIADGYGGVLTSDSDNPLVGRPAFVGESAGYPAMSAVSLVLGKDYANRPVQIRFRIGADQAVGAAGWEIDNIRVEGITNTPFATVGDDVGSCDGGEEPDPEDGGCGCQSSDASGGIALALLLLVLGWRRRFSLSV